ERGARRGACGTRRPACRTGRAASRHSPARAGSARSRQTRPNYARRARARRRRSDWPGLWRHLGRGCSLAFAARLLAASLCSSPLCRVARESRESLPMLLTLEESTVHRKPLLAGYCSTAPGKTLSQRGAVGARGLTRTEQMYYFYHVYCCYNRYRRCHRTARTADVPQYQNALQLRSADRKSTRLNSSHVKSSYAVFCSKNKTRLSLSIG